ncbi:MAG: glycine cleavage system protein GcvH [Clostridiales bacterium]|jgi:glycine cleavage system H protein|nr:glycine cleavage system protein GcvH [Clostridiales bacterium]
MKFSKTHEWITVEGKTATVGVTDYAAAQMGDIVFVELPDVGAKLTIGKSFANVESVKAVSEIFSPVSGRVTEVNAELSDAPELINKDAFSAYLVRVELDAVEDGLLERDEYEASKESF